MSSSDQKEQFKRYKEDVERRGKPFFPYAMFHDTVMSLVVVAVIVGLACIWYFTSGEDPKTCGSGDSCLLGPRYSEPADPGTTSFVPRPDWYFYFLFYLLRIFKWPESVILGTVGIPTILMILLFALPFIDRRVDRRLLHRPVAIVAALLVIASMGVLTYKGATAKESLASENIQNVPRWAQEQGFADDKQAVAGAGLFAESGCMNCHTYLGDGSSNLGAPDLSDEGTKGRGKQWQIDHLKNPLRRKSPWVGSPLRHVHEQRDDVVREPPRGEPRAALARPSLELRSKGTPSSQAIWWTSWSDDSRPEPPAPRPEASAPMFDRISPVYDLMNRVLTLGSTGAGGGSPRPPWSGPATVCSTPAAGPATSRSPTSRRAER